MASIHKTKTGKWEVRWRENGAQRSRTYDDRLDAEEAQLSIKRKGHGPVARAGVPTLREFTEEWWKTKELSDTTRRGYKELLEAHIFPMLGEKRVAELTPPMLAEWQQERREAGAGPTALGKAQTLLSQILDYAVLPWQHLDANPVSSLPTPPRKRKPRRWLTAWDVEAIRGWYAGRGDIGSATLVSVLAYVGIRPQDALALRWDDLGEGLAVTKKNVDGVIVPGSKTGEGYERRVYLPDTVRDDLRGWRNQTAATSDLIFPNRQGEPWTKSQFNNWRSRRQGNGGKGKCFKLAAEEVGLGWTLTPYALRHTAATLFIHAGRTHTWVAHQLGHSPAVSLRTYQHLYAAEHQPGQTEDDFIREARGFAPCSENVRRPLEKRA